MTRRRRGSGLLVLLMWAATAGHLDAKPDAYIVSWLGIPVVDVTIGKSSAGDRIVAEYTAKTRPWFSRLYSVDNLYRITTSKNPLLPLIYEKQINEAEMQDTLQALYQRDAGTIQYSNGVSVDIEPDCHNMFSALLWLQLHAWQPGDTADLLVEVEGQIWQVEMHCENVIQDTAQGELLAQIETRFIRLVTGAPIVDPTDMLSFWLPGEDHELRFGLNLARQQFQWVEFGRKPFLIRAELRTGEGVE